MNVTIILVGTTHPGNIGATARAMKNMGLNELRLVNPKSFPDPEASARASGAEEILRNTTIFDNLSDAMMLGRVLFVYYKKDAMVKLLQFLGLSIQD